jgi:hypothetical protein
LKRQNALGSASAERCDGIRHGGRLAALRPNAAAEAARRWTITPKRYLPWWKSKTTGPWMRSLRRCASAGSPEAARRCFVFWNAAGLRTKTYGPPARSHWSPKPQVANRSPQPPTAPWLIGNQRDAPNPVAPATQAGRPVALKARLYRVAGPHYQARDRIYPPFPPSSLPRRRPLQPCRRAVRRQLDRRANRPYEGVQYGTLIPWHLTLGVVILRRSHPFASTVPVIVAVRP